MRKEPDVRRHSVEREPRSPDAYTRPPELSSEPGAGTF